MTDAGDTKEPGATLTPKERAFAHEYVIDLNKTQAAIRAGYSKKSASTQGGALFRKPQVRELIDHLAEEHIARRIMSREQVLIELSKLSGFSMRGILKTNDDGAPVIDLDNMTDDQFDALAEVSLSDDGKLKVKAHSKVQALGMMAKFHGLLVDKVQVSVDDTFADKMAAALARAKGGE